MTYPHPDRIVRIPIAEEMSSYCNQHIHRLEDKNQFPKRFKLAEDGGRYGAVGWRLSDLQSWVEWRAERARNPKTPATWLEWQASQHVSSGADRNEQKGPEDGDDEEDDDGPPDGRRGRA